MLIHAEIYIYMLDTYRRNELIRRKHDNDKDAERKTQEVFFNNILPLTLFVRIRKGCSRVACERELEIEHNCNILTPLLWPSRCVFLVLLTLNRRPRAHRQMLAFFIASYQHLLWTPNSIGVSEGPLGRVWLSLPHLVSSCLAPSAWCGFPYHTSSPTVWNSTGNCSGSLNSTELYNHSAPTRSLKSNV